MPKDFLLSWNDDNDNDNNNAKSILFYATHNAIKITINNNIDSAINNAIDNTKQQCQTTSYLLCQQCQYQKTPFSECYPNAYAINKANSSF